MNKKQLIVAWVILFLLSGCAPAAFHITKKGLYDSMLASPASQHRVYNYAYDDVYDAIISVLGKRLQYGVSRLYTTKDIIYSNYYESQSRFVFFGYAYLFTLKKVDDTHTEVSLRASGGVGIVSDNDMLDKYIKEELEYLSRTKLNKEPLGGIQ